MSLVNDEVVFHKKGQRAPDHYIKFLGWCKSYWAEDGYHFKVSGKLAPNPKT